MGCLTGVQTFLLGWDITDYLRGGCCWGLIVAGKNDYSLLLLNVSLTLYYSPPFTLLTLPAFLESELLSPPP